MSELRRLLDPVRRRVRLMVSRALIRLVDDDPRLQELQISLLHGETRSGVERFQRFGFSSVPITGCEAVAVFVGGNRDHGVVVAEDDRRYRPQGLSAGEVIVYDAYGQYVRFHDDGRLEMFATNEVVVNAPVVTINGDLQVNGDIDATGHIIDVGGNTDNHTH